MGTTRRPNGDDGVGLCVCGRCYLDGPEKYAALVAEVDRVRDGIRTLAGTLDDRQNGGCSDRPMLTTGNARHSSKWYTDWRAKMTGDELDERQARALELLQEHQEHEHPYKARLCGQKIRELMEGRE